MCYKQERDYKKVIFVLCVPGEDEEKAGHPAAGDTGIKLNQILVHLNSGKPEIFPYLDKSHYSITNSYDKPIYPNNNVKKRSTPTRSQVLHNDNIQRFISDIKGYEYVILCGEEAKLLADYVQHSSCIKTIHFGNKGLRGKYPNNHHEMKALSSGLERDQKRVALCAREIIEHF
ncbi:hypothetical protein [Vibrio harveyi]|uniref:hypothetical protein n=1 Tax=Vibrio harveyi TaxID=669 RepID=UPI00066DA43A|nr:hypothetical protein [Vibrio harveyi]